MLGSTFVSADELPALLFGLTRTSVSGIEASELDLCRIMAESRVNHERSLLEAVVRAASGSAVASCRGSPSGRDRRDGDGGCPRARALPALIRETMSTMTERRWLSLAANRGPRNA